MYIYNIYIYILYVYIYMCVCKYVCVWIQSVQLLTCLYECVFRFDKLHLVSVVYVAVF